MTEVRNDPAQTPWYRNPWPWFLIAIPGLTVVAGFVTFWLAVTTADGTVSDDYYKQGLALSQLQDRDDAARDLGLQANVMRSGREIRVLLKGQWPAGQPDHLKLHLTHPTRSGLDYLVALVKGADGFYSGQLEADLNGRRNVVLEDQDSTWRLKGNWQLSGEALLQLFPPAVNSPR